MVVAERELEFVSSDGSAQTCRLVLSRPVQEESDGPWFCSYSIEAPTFQTKSRSAGEDSLQSLILAQRLLAVELMGEFRFTWQLKEAHNKSLQPIARENARSG